MNDETKQEVLYRSKLPVRAERFDGTDEAAKRLGIEWEEGNGWDSDSRPSWFVPDYNFAVEGYDENVVEEGDIIVKISDHFLRIMRPDDFLKEYEALPTLSVGTARLLERAKKDRDSLDEIKQRHLENCEREEVIDDEQ